MDGFSIEGFDWRSIILANRSRRHAWESYLSCCCCCRWSLESQPRLIALVSLFSSTMFGSAENPLFFLTRHKLSEEELVKVRSILRST
ncbi:hypothetical protein BP00DRAFT_14952 [Aspergillus indologenus CBS 114.80]|uniref:Uncharacterized protein n=1 Tax=Aspergillus indologenus CBS 114.80 TaxID=1450541 RepID=A0A2V5HZW7_9EURO|nr:hypothetical protein BP00DRAFT_14952 [Aspergillus indologenus CBS 114.80]